MLSALLAACGYHFVGVGQLPGGVEQIHIAILENPTAETGIEVVLTNALVQEFIRNGHSIAPNPVGADGILTGRVVDLRINSIARKSAHSSLTGRVTLSLELSLMNLEGRRLWIGTGITANQAYDIEFDRKLATEENRLIAIASLSRRLAETVYDRLTTGF